MSDWDDLRYFLAVARNGTVSGASVDLKVNQSTVSRRISAYEKQHDVRLFERLPSGYVMTQAAENIYQHALEIEARNQIVERELFGRDTRLQGKLCITALHSMADRLLLPHLEEFRNLYPDIELELLLTTEIRDLGAREADIALRGTNNPPDHLVGKKVANFGRGIYTSAKYQARRLQRHELILWRNDPQPDWAAKYFPDAQIALRVDDVITLQEAVYKGLGIARLPCWVADTGTSALTRLDLEDEPTGWGLWVLIHADLRSTARVRVCRDFLIDKLSAHKDLIAGKRSTYL